MRWLALPLDFRTSFILSLLFITFSPSFILFPFNLSYPARLAQTWRTTPTKWYPIPVLLGAFVLIGIQARRNYVQDKKALENGGRTRGGKIVDENGHVVTMQGPWTVSNSIIDLGKRKRETRLMEKEKQV